MYSTLLREPSSQQFILVKHVCAQCAFAIILKWKYPYIVFLRCSRSILRLYYLLNIICRKALWWVEHHFIEHWTNSNTFYWSSNELEPVHILVIELKHPILVSNDQISNLLRLSLDLINYSNIIFLNIEQTWTYSSIGNRTPYFWLRMIEHSSTRH